MTHQKTHIEVRADILERFRAIRLFHWREFKSLHQKALMHRCYDTTDGDLMAVAYNKAANVHLGFVQDLNYFFPIEDTAERDASLYNESTAGNGE